MPKFPLVRTARFCALALPVLLWSSLTLAQSSKTYVVAFNQQSGLPANVDQLVTSAGGKIVAKLPEIGGIEVTSSDANFISKIAKDSSVRAADEATPTQLIDPVAQDAGNNGGTFSPTGPDTDPRMPDSLGHEQWDKKKMNATLDGSY